MRDAAVQTVKYNLAVEQLLRGVHSTAGNGCLPGFQQNQQNERHIYRDDEQHRDKNHRIRMKHSVEKYLVIIERYYMVRLLKTVSTLRYNRNMSSNSKHRLTHEDV